MTDPTKQCTNRGRRRPNQQRDRHDAGFTLVEIVIAIVLVGILSAVAVVGIGSLTGKGNAAACESSLDAAKAGAVVYFANNAAYPTTLAEMTTSSPAALDLGGSVSLDSPTVASASNWTLTITPGVNGGAPTFACGDDGGVGGSGTAFTGTTACPGPFAGWVGEYYSNIALTGTPALCRDDAALNFAWAGGAPAAGVPADNFSVRWTKTVTFTAGTYNFTVGSDDGSRLYIDGTLLIDFWTDHGYATSSATSTVTAGTHTVVMEFYERGGDARATLTWA